MKVKYTATLAIVTALLPEGYGITEARHNDLADQICGDLIDARNKAEQTELKASSIKADKISLSGKWELEETGCRTPALWLEQQTKAFVGVQEKLEKAGLVGVRLAATFSPKTIEWLIAKRFIVNTAKHPEQTPVESPKEGTALNPSIKG